MSAGRAGGLPVQIVGHVAALALLVAQGACDSSTDQAMAIVAPTYNAEIGPLLESRCVSCHQAGGSAPFSLESYEAAKARGAAVKAATASRQMPPWGVDNSGTCQTFQHTRWLTDAEIARIGAWVDGGMHEGDGKKFVARVAPPKRLEGRVLQVEQPERYVPVTSSGSNHDDYRCFLIDPKLDKDQFVTAYDVIPGNPKVVHHVVAYSVNLDVPVGMDLAGKPVTNRDAIATLRAREGDRPGWPCYGAAGDGIAISGTPLPGWAPGVGLTEFPHETGLPLRKGEQLVLQIHFHVGDEEADAGRTALRLRLADTVPRASHTMVIDSLLETLFSPMPAVIPPMTPNFVFDRKMDAAEFEGALGRDGMAGRKWMLAGVYPHMHKTGRKLRVVLERGSELQCAAEVNRWDFNWQQYYFYEKPVPLSDLKSLRLTCEFDTTGREKPTLPGFGSDDEMCLVGLYLVEDTSR